LDGTAKIAKKIMTVLDKLFKNKWRNYLMAHRVAGHWFYTYKNVQFLHNRRQFLFQNALKESEYGITYEDNLACSHLTVEAARVGDMGKVIAYQNALQTYLGLAFNHQTTFKLCDAIILMDNEPELTKDEEFTLKKKSAFENSDEVKGFFLKCIESTLKDLGRLQNDISIADYLSRREAMLIEKQFLDLIIGKK
jgi:hypothetical protein